MSSDSFIRPEVLARVYRKRGRRHPFYDIQGDRTAHLVVDLQTVYLKPGGLFEIPQTRAIVPKVNSISRAVRAAGGLVVFLQHTLDAESLTSWSVYYDHIVNETRRRDLISTLSPGSADHALWHELDICESDWQIQKRRFGAFMPQSSDLHERLQRRNIDTVVITGTATNCCCESTAREAMTLNYRTFVIEDATATDTEDEHKASLSMLLHTFADVRSTSSLLALVNKGCP